MRCYVGENEARGPLQLIRLFCTFSFYFLSPLQRFVRLAVFPTITLPVNFALLPPTNPILVKVSASHVVMRGEPMKREQSVKTNVKVKLTLLLELDICKTISLK